MAPKHEKAVTKYLSDLGYQPGEYNERKKCTYWSKWGKPDVMVHSNISEHAFRAIKRDTDKLHGKKSISAVRKRNVTEIKARQQSERERLSAARDRRQAELDEYQSRMDARLEGMTPQEFNAVCAEIERREREIRELERLMMQTPNSGHKGVEHAKHRA